MDGFALVGITPFIQGGQKSIEDAIGRLKNFIEKNDVTVRELALRNDARLPAMQFGERFPVPFQLCGRQFQLLSERRIAAAVVQHQGLQIAAHLLVKSILLQNLLRHSAGDQAGEVQTPKQSLLIGLFGHQALKLPSPGEPIAEQVDDSAFGLSGVAQDKDIFSCQQRNGNHLDQLIAFCHLRLDLPHAGTHFVSQCLIHRVIPPFRFYRSQTRSLPGVADSIASEIGTPALSRARRPASSMMKLPER